MKTIKMPIPDEIPHSQIQECIKSIRDLNEDKLFLTFDSSNAIFKDKDRVLILNYPEYFEDRDIFITGSLIGAILYNKQWKK